MKIKKTNFSTMLTDLYGRKKYHSHIELDREYWWCWPSDSDIYKYTGHKWNKLKITYKRSGVSFYVLSDYPDYPEQYFDDSSFLASTLVFAQIDPMKDLEWGEFDKKMSKKDLEDRYCFSDERTVVLNWNNSREADIDINDMNFFDLTMVLDNIIKKKDDENE